MSKRGSSWASGLRVYDLDWTVQPFGHSVRRDRANPIDRLQDVPDRGAQGFPLRPRLGLEPDPRGPDPIRHAGGSHTPQARGPAPETWPGNAGGVLEAAATGRNLGGPVLGNPSIRCPSFQGPSLMVHGQQGPHIMGRGLMGRGLISPNLIGATPGRSKVEAACQGDRPRSRRVARRSQESSNEGPVVRRPGSTGSSSWLQQLAPAMGSNDRIRRCASARASDARAPAPGHADGGVRCPRADRA